MSVRSRIGCVLHEKKYIPHSSRPCLYWVEPTVAGQQATKLCKSNRIAAWQPAIATVGFGRVKAVLLEKNKQAPAAGLVGYS